jgi:hypothetical protein
MGNSPTVAAEFRIIQGPLKGKKVRFETNIVTIGRSEEANICLPGDRSVSRIHAEVQLVDGHYVLKNRSNSGTFVNDKLVEERQLVSGDRILIGELQLLEFTEISGLPGATGRKGIRSPKLLVGGAVYLLLLAAMAVFLSTPSSLGKSIVGGEQIQELVNRYTTYTSNLHLPKEEQDARVRVVEAYLRAGLIAQRQGQYAEARQIYLRLLEFARQRDNPLYQYAIVQLRSVPESR